MSKAQAGMKVKEVQKRPLPNLLPMTFSTVKKYIKIKKQAERPKPVIERNPVSKVVKRYLPQPCKNLQ